MLNIGLALQRPYESRYSAYRRFLVANGTSQVIEIRKELYALYGSMFKSPSKITTPEFFYIYESDRKSGIQIHAPEYSKILLHTIRNCPECARSCYHSDLYQYPWLTVCPVHKQPLTYSCPECHQPWPSWPAIKQRKCSTCGASYHWDDLKTANAFTEWPMDMFKVLDDAINRYDHIVKGYAVSPYMDDFVYDIHMSVDIWHPLLPSVLAALYPDLRESFELYRIEYTDYRVSTYPLSKITVSYPEDRLQRHWVTMDKFSENIRREIEEQIRHEINKKYNNEKIDSIKGFFFNEYQYMQDISNVSVIAFYIWKSLVNDRGLPLSHIFTSYRPRVPCLLKSLVFDDVSKFEIEYTNVAHIEYVIPEALQEVLYREDLCNTFVNILNYISEWRTMVLEKGTWLNIDPLPSDAFNPVSQQNQRFAFIMQPNGDVIFLHPSTCGHFSLNGIDD